MLKVYSIEHSLYCAKLRLVLRTKGLDWQDIPPPGGVGSPEYLALVPTGNLPALVDGDLILTDSEAIGEYLEEKYPNPAMLPDDLTLRAQCRERSRFHDTRLEPALRLLFRNVSPATRNAGEINAAHAEITKRMTALATLLARAPLPPDRLWLGDCGLVITLEWLKLMGSDSVLPPLNWPREVSKYLHQMHNLPLISKELEFYRPHMQAWMIEKSN